MLSNVQACRQNFAGYLLYSFGAYSIVLVCLPCSATRVMSEPMVNVELLGDCVLVVASTF